MYVCMCKHILVGHVLPEESPRFWIALKDGTAGDAPRRSGARGLGIMLDTLDGRNPAQIDMWFIHVYPC